MKNITLPQKWKYHFEERLSNLTALDQVNFNGGSAIYDIDLNGDIEVIVADFFESDDDEKKIKKYLKSHRIELLKELIKDMEEILSIINKE